MICSVFLRVCMCICSRQRMCHAYVMITMMMQAVYAARWRKNRRTCGRHSTGREQTKENGEAWIGHPTGGKSKKKRYTQSTAAANTTREAAPGPRASQRDCYLTPGTESPPRPVGTIKRCQGNGQTRVNLGGVEPSDLVRRHGLRAAR